MNELKNRGVDDIMLAVVDGLKGVPDAIVQTCTVHLLRNSMDFVSWKDRKPMTAEQKGIYRAIDAKTAEEALTQFEGGSWGGAIQPLPRAGEGPGARSFPSSHSPPRCAKSSIRQMPSRRSIQRCGGRPAQEVISPAMTRRQSFCF